MLKIIFLKFIRYFAVMIWNIIRFFRWNKNIDLKDIKKIIFNRKDRIWDAVITKPFIILFSKYIKEELKLDIKIEVECSKYNEFVFKEWNNEQYYKIISENFNAQSYWFNLIEYIKNRFKILKKYIKSKKILWENKYIVYIDLVWNSQNIIDKIEKKYYFIWWNTFFYNYLYDYNISSNYVSGNNNNLITSYINLIEWCFSLTNFWEYINRNNETFFTDYEQSKAWKWILIFVWNKEFRNLSIATRNELIVETWHKNQNDNIVVLDDNLNILHNNLIKYNNYPNNVSFKENKFSREELKSFTKNFKLIIWIDWWWFNYIRTVTNSFEIFTLANSNVRSIFSWDNKYKETPLWNNRFLNDVTIWSKKFWYIYKKSLILPSYDIEVPKKIFEDLPINKLLKTLENFLNT